MTEPQQPTAEAKRRRFVPVPVACAVLFLLGGLAAFLFWPKTDAEPQRSATDVPLGVEQAVIVRYSGPRLAARPYRRGASVNLRIAHQVQKGDVRVYDIRYVVSLPGEFDLTEYLTSSDGRSIDDLPSFRVRGLTSLTKDIETRIQEIETVRVGIWHWYYESLVGSGVLWVAWLLGLIFIGRPRRPQKPAPAPAEPSIAERIEQLLAAMARGELSVDEKARLEALLLGHWRELLGLARQRMAVACRDMESSDELGRAYGQLQAWLHNPRAGIGPEQFSETYAQWRRRTETAGPVVP
jgi:hypothetical protein